MKKYEFILKDLDCAHCANKIQTELSKKQGLENVNVNFAKLKLIYETNTVTVEEVAKIIKSLEPEVEMIPIENKEKKENTNSKTKKQVIRLVIGIILAAIGLYSKLPIILNIILVILGYGTLLYRTAKNAVKLFKQSKNIDENLLVTISCIGAYLVGQRLEGLMVIILYEIGKILEEKAINKTRKSVTELMNIKPEYANIKQNETIIKTSPEEAKIGDIIVIKKGEKVPLDGVIINGNAHVDMSSLTGESRLQNLKENDEILSGSIINDGLLEVRVTKEYKNSTVNKILDLVENATDKKAKTETFVNKCAKIYTPVVLGIAILVAAFLPMISNVKYLGENGSIYRALIFLVISCPCAIAISVPLNYFSGIGKASKQGILIKGSEYLDSIKDIKEIIFDKTGTLTKGEFEINKIEVYDNSYTEKQILEYAVRGESYSNHPIAKSIIKSANINVAYDKVKNYEEIAGKGIKYEFDGKEILIGNSSLTGAEKKEEDLSKIYVKVNENIVGAIHIGDTIKEKAKEVIESLNKQGIKTEMFTGDSEQVALSVAEKISIQDVKYEMLPNDKYTELEKQINKYLGTNKKLAFVGDGINDAPVLARADIGISMGGVGSESAIEASDVVIMTDSLEKIDEAIKISKKTCRIIKQNLIFAIGVKILVLILSTVGITGMWQAVFADVGVTILTIFNTLRVLK